MNDLKANKLLKKLQRKFQSNMILKYLLEMVITVRVRKRTFKFNRII